jgi:hypothetical protein
VIKGHPNFSFYDPDVGQTDQVTGFDFSALVKALGVDVAVMASP